MMRSIFLGKAIHWLVLVIVMAVLWWLGAKLVQTRDYHLFLTVLFALTVGAVAVIIVTTRKGEQVTREPFEDDPGS
jgi:endonuclease/exonuclease/phosphatase (EEP) superfamily protein YafD